MINTFNEHTKRLSDDESNIYLPAILNFLRAAKGKENAITNGRLRGELEDFRLKVGAARVRKIINHIRVFDKLSCLIASNRGYYVSDDPGEIERYIDSLRGREEAIKAVREALQFQKEEFIADALSSACL